MKTNHIYIDETGNPKNTKAFVICFVLFTDRYEIDFTIKNIEGFKYKKFGNIYQELHFNKESLPTKIGFFNCLQKDKFSLRYYLATIIDGNWCNENYIIASIEENKDVVQNSVLYIDGNFPRKHRKNIISKIIKELKTKGIYVKDIKYHDSKNNNLIQLADMCAGCIRRKIERGTKEDKKLYKLIKKFITYPPL